jgi:hypothetical protein
MHPPIFFLENELKEKKESVGLVENHQPGVDFDQDLLECLDFELNRFEKTEIQTISESHDFADSALPTSVLPFRSYYW